MAPWFTAYRDEFLRLLRFEGHETVDHPMGCLFIASSEAPDPLKAFDDLIQSAPWPPLMLQEYMFPVQDDDFPKAYVLLHDGSKGGQQGLEVAREKLKLLQRTYSAGSCTLLIINTSGGRSELVGSPPVPYESFWKPRVPGAGVAGLEGVPAVPDIGLGRWMSKTDTHGLKDFVEKYVSRSLLPKLDLRIGKLSSALLVKKKSLAGRLLDKTSSYLKNLTPSKDLTTSTGFRYYTPESQARQLGDILFLLHRYEDAQEAYTSVTVSKEHYPRMYAGLHEFQGLCQVMATGYGDPNVHFSKAYEYYMKVPGKTGRQLGLRTAIIHAAFCQHSSNYTAANQVLQRAFENEKHLRGALLLEQAALMLFLPKPPQLRKFAFQMALAGLWYYTDLFKGLAMHCYESVYTQYGGRRWEVIEEHIGEMMLTFATEKGQTELAVEWVNRLLSLERQSSPVEQDKHLRMLCDMLSKLEVKGNNMVLEMAVPAIDIVDIEVAGEKAMGNSLAKEVGGEAWRPLENSFRDPQSTSYATGLGSLPDTPDEDFHTAVCGEPISLLCKFSNPLKVELTLEDVRLLFDESPANNDDAGEHGDTAVFKQKVVLHGGESTFARLTVVPHTVGNMRVRGVSWRLRGVISGKKVFNSDLSKNSVLPLRAKGYHPWLTFYIVRPLPLLEPVSMPWPEELWVGEVWQADWKLRSSGGVPLQDVQLAVSYPDLLACRPVGMAAQLDVDGNGCTDGNVPAEHRRNGDNCVFDLEMPNPLLPGEQLCTSLWICPSQPGDFTVHCMFQYEGTDRNIPLQRRVLCMSFLLHVQPIVAITHQVTRDPYRPSCIFSISLRNQHPDEHLAVEEITCKGGDWGIQTMSGPSNRVDLSHRRSIAMDLPPHQQVEQHFLVQSAQSDRTGVDAWSEEAQRQGSPVGCSTCGALEHLQQRQWAMSCEWSLAARPPMSCDTLRLCLKWHECVPQRRNMAGLVKPRWGMHCFTYCYDRFANPVCLVAKGVFSVTHDFGQQPTCVVPVAVYVRNCSTTTTSVCVEAGRQWERNRERNTWMASALPTGGAEGGASNPDSAPGGERTPAGLPASRSALWCGQTQVSVPQVEAGEEIKVGLWVAISHPGVYEMTDYSCSWSLEESTPVHGSTDGPPLLLTVMDRQATNL
ncbi:unnamed protein product [Ostreobium quekettii]|uniref:Uncharacterized protein n=1 Tax=Ostreobium quekettii TaxID=121088 RepID=A0A8S1IZY8_9CHLO|nr:unnamed protein product [Ostreobium quekettii]|eukprot:evm.model.scf_778.2 EVM.evm.TU.scf_778.2   scf_778:23192-27256(-)